MSGVAASRVAVIIPAAGSGVRFGDKTPKAFFELDGISLLTRSALTLSMIAEVLVIAVPAEYVSQAAQELDAIDAQVHIVPGGATRQDSVAAALQIVPADIDFVLVHDAARPLVPISVVADVVQALSDGAKAVIPVLPVIDTIKRVTSDGVVVETIHRETLRRAQTPQGFTKSLLDQAFIDPTHVATDESGLVERLGVPVQTVMGSERAFKITTPADVAYALALLGDTQ